jgi:hypothetical protein
LCLFKVALSVSKAGSLPLTRLGGPAAAPAIKSALGDAAEPLSATEGGVVRRIPARRADAGLLDCPATDADSGRGADAVASSSPITLLLASPECISSR